MQECTHAVSPSPNSVLTTISLVVMRTGRIHTPDPSFSTTQLPKLDTLMPSSTSCMVCDDALSELLVILTGMSHLGEGHSYKHQTSVHTAHTQVFDMWHRADVQCNQANLQQKVPTSLFSYQNRGTFHFSRQINGQLLHDCLHVHTTANTHAPCTAMLASVQSSVQVSSYEQHTICKRLNKHSARMYRNVSFSLPYTFQHT